MNELSKDSFLAEVKGPKPVIIDFWAEWCGPCRVLSPIIEELSKEFAGKAKFFKVNVDENPELSQEHHIMAIPTVMFYKNGKIVDQFTGAFPKSEIKKKIEGILGDLK